jgi:HlyD family secretion protein
MKKTRIYRRIAGAGLAAGGLLALALWPDTLVVDVETAARGPLVVTVDEEGRTRVRDRFVVSAPVSGRVLRIELEPGDRVARGDVVARLDAGFTPLLDARSREDARAAIEAARASVGRARAEEDRARAALAQADRELERARRLTDGGALPAQHRDAREADVLQAREALKGAAFAVGSAVAELARAEARAGNPSAGRTGIVTARAPVDGVVLRRLRESESVVPAGEPLVEIGEPGELEIVSDLLSTDAARVRPGARAMVDQWGSGTSLAAIVRRIEPSGFTKVSALGVEEQRVNVILDLLDAGHEDAVLGDAYRVEVRIVLSEAADVLKVPTAALFRHGQDQWAVYAVREGRAFITPVEIGRQTGREAEVLQGLAERTRVIVHPADALTDGARVTERDGS